ncbi:dihydrodipicolinate synthetase family protein [Paraburkholderia caffeinilytica]|uniref:Dihydrodipicolinate synthase family protein n=1 Tax=Paraburkholderia caffeinilytica TaxID=1761016 RepID=A0ABQ1MWA4_9BURK|nr:dihydrodipicolinate synthase family protein [Paraburkholderia caffeinilytica]AXL50666.1 dihydrodipicolinate synthetase family protein [Paraburkholderia caffeinilytica]GGC45572.1 dihydrodipicolinate synthase family protein [Paraburkholderia caffeinilytica]CAB3801541.1 putative 2-dehydro-3-deoxy-D-pentonate aldolase YjhH [Paraburkholderia caffeinilytica]
MNSIASPTGSIAGIYPILYAFFDRDNRLDRAAMRRQMQAVVRTQAPGVAVLGLATEVNKLSRAEREHIVQWAIEDSGGTLPLAVTVSGTSVEAQRELAHYAIAQGASWLILQPPALEIGAIPQPEAFYFDFFAAVMEGLGVPVGIQNAPEYLGVGLSPDNLERLATQCPNFRLLKGEGPSIVLAETVARVGHRMPVLNGRGGMELIDNLRAGCAGMIVAPDCFDWQQRIYQAFVSGDVAQAEALYREVLPAIVFVMQSLDTLICYGKRIAAWRMGFEVEHDRDTRLQPSHFGLEAARRFAAMLGPLP